MMSAAVNVVLALSCNIVLLICLLLSFYQPGASLHNSTIIYEGDCDKAPVISLILHLLLNILSGLVLASSHFFMQILSAPSREEVNQAHSWLRSLDIGIPSIKNLWHVSRFKRLGWLGFLASSLPIHLFANSAVFQTTYMGVEWQFTIATDAFVRGEPCFPPAARQNLSSTAKEASAWTYLSAEDCQAQYISCVPKTRYDDVVVISFRFDPSTNLSDYWNPLVPPEVINSLGFSAHCRVPRTTSREQTCRDSCLGALGVESTYEAEFAALRVRHCLAKPIQPTCQAVVSNMLLLIVMLCTTVKTVQGSIVLWKLPTASIVTPGDAIESFLSDPDPHTEGLGSMCLRDTVRLEVSSYLSLFPYGPSRLWVPETASELTPLIQPRQWKKSQHRLLPTIPYSGWVRNYATYLAGLALLIAGFAMSSEWSYSDYLGYRSLRVSFPSGEQVSSYRLQLPYRYSVPLIIYVCIGFFVMLCFYDKKTTNGAIMLRLFFAYTPLFFLLLFIMSVVFMICLPALLSFRKLKGDTVVGGWNSLVVSAPCHTIEPPKTRESFEVSRDTHSQSEDGTALISLPLDRSKRKFRWVSMTIPVELADDLAVAAVLDVCHLGFGAEEDGVASPNDGQYYI
ncbi:hypothetical protein F4778DRAFT_771847 [Xylariomycetidae sp. FL2044]|nr:hypothetical protein F4778DRAFT_771847 [Xylariomycetidae sp. FL2044]